MQWTAKQRKAIDSRGGELLISAGAGSGKTAVLTARIVALLREGSDLERMLIMTFTRAAAGEMRRRIGEALSKEADNAHLQMQLEKLPDAPIYTIDAFCNRLVKQYFYLLNIDPAFRIMEEDQAKALQRQVLQDYLEERYAKEEKDFEILSQTYTTGWQDDSFENMILDTYGQIQSQPNPLAWLHQQVEAFHLKDGDYQTSSFVKTALQDGEMMLQGAKEQLAYGLYLARLPEGPELYAPLFEAEMALCDDLIQASRKGLTALKEALTAVAAMPDFRKFSATNCDQKLKKAAQDARNKAKEILKDIHARWMSTDEQLKRLSNVYPVLKTLEGVIVDFHHRLMARKGELGAYEFWDIAQLALKVLSFPEVSQALQQQIDYLFIDEYQDTSDLQEALLQQCSRGDNLFMVGDLKQSIYGFRTARPHLFLQKYLNFREDGPHCRMDLNVNFRSRPHILRAVNQLFTHLMTPELGGFAYDEKAALQPGREEADQAHKVAVYFFLKDEAPQAQSDQEIQTITAEENVFIEAQRVADIIKGLIGRPITCEDGAWPIQYKDIAVLLRSVKNTLPQWQEVFADNGIPLFAEGQKIRLNDPEVAVLLSLLRVLDNFQQDMPLIAVLRSFLFSFTEEDLLQVRLEGGKTPFFYQAFETCAQGNTPLAQRCQKVLQTLEQYREMAERMPVDQLLYCLLQETGFEEWVGACPGGQAKGLNLHMLLAQATAFVQEGKGGIYGFLQYFDALSLHEEKMLDMPPLAGEEENVVRLMSVHKSKGLQFPVVIVAQLGKFFHGNHQAPLKIHHQRGLGPRWVALEKRSVYTTLAEDNVSFIQTKENIEEEIRILYVALTRAQERLILTGTLSQKDLQSFAKPLSPHFLLSAPCPLTWIGGILLRHEDGEPLRSRLDIPVPILEQEETFAVHVRPLGVPLPPREPMEEQYFRLLEKPIIPSEEVKRLLNFVFPFEDDTRIPTKVAPHELYAQDFVPQFFERKPAFLQERDQLTPLDKGNIIHRFCQWADPFKVTEEEGILTQIDMAIKKGILPKKAKDVLTVKALAPLFKGPLFDRMRKSSQCLKEQPFTFSLPACDVFPQTQSTEPVLVQGIIDCCFLEQNQWVIVDYKTDRVTTGPGETAFRYKGQLDLYAKALSTMTGKRVKEKIIYLFDVSQQVILP